MYIRLYAIYYHACAVKTVGVSILSTKLLKGRKNLVATGTLWITKIQLVEIACKIITLPLKIK